MAPLFYVDAFAHSPFQGNQAAVLRAEDVKPELYQSIAAELNLSETSFVCKSDAEGMRYNLKRTST